MAWTVADIKSKIRLLTGRPGTGDISEADLLEAINNYYLYMLPQEVELRDLQTVWQKVTNTGDSSLDADIVDLNRPAYITTGGGTTTEVPLYTDKDHFFTKYDYLGGPTAAPTAALLYARKVYLRPEPDAYYTFTAFATQLPTAFTLDADTPTDIKWGPLIAYGTAIEILKEAGQTQEAGGLTDMYAFHARSIGKKQAEQEKAGDAPQQAPPER